MVYTIDNIQEGIDARIEAMRNGTHEMDRLCILSKMWMQDYPEELEQNVLEWVNNDHLSDIDYHGISIKKVLQAKKRTDDFFPLVMRNFKYYKERNFVGGNYVCFRGL